MSDYLSEREQKLKAVDDCRAHEPGIVLHSDVDEYGVRHTWIRCPQTGEVVYRWEVDGDE